MRKPFVGGSFERKGRNQRFHQRYAGGFEAEFRFLNSRTQPGPKTTDLNLKDVCNIGRISLMKRQFIFRIFPFQLTINVLFFL